MWQKIVYYYIIFLLLALLCYYKLGILIDTNLRRAGDRNSAVLSVSAEEQPPWKWICEDGRCSKIKNEPEGEGPALSVEACKMFCNEYGLLWPRPTGTTNLGGLLSQINISNIEIQIEKRGKSDHLMTAAGKRFKKLVSNAVPHGISPNLTGRAVYVYLVNENPDVKGFRSQRVTRDPITKTPLSVRLFGSGWKHYTIIKYHISLNNDESYGIRVSAESNERINATIFGNNFFGLRNGLETLAQLIVYDDLRNHLLIVRDVTIDDKPVYPYRGILLDTARNYFSIESIKETIEAMATVKLNTFHWHITDTQSFPFMSKRRPELTKYGAYSPSKVYTEAMMREVVQFGLERGVRVLPEFDAPAHVGEGWQDTNLTLCFKAEPWSSYCVEPPCGQVNPTKDELYDVLEDIYRDMADVFPTDLFHMGGDEVSERCWNSSSQVQMFMEKNHWGLSKASYLQLWNYFQNKAQDRAYKAFGKRLPLILWTSTLTDYIHVEKFLKKDDYIFQVWTTGQDLQIKGLLEKGYRLIISNYDALYLDCGFASWVRSGNNWCSPYIGWQKVYENSPKEMAGEYAGQVLGGEAALWSEQSDSASLQGRLWPRAAALAERLWAEPRDGWRAAERRMLHERERLVRMGIKADSLEPEWCYQNDGYCHA